MFFKFYIKNRIKLKKENIKKSIAQSQTENKQLIYIVTLNIKSKQIQILKSDIGKDKFNILNHISTPLVL